MQTYSIGVLKARPHWNACQRCRGARWNDLDSRWRTCSGQAVHLHKVASSSVRALATVDLAPVLKELVPLHDTLGKLASCRQRLEIVRPWVHSHGHQRPNKREVWHMWWC